MSLEHSVSHCTGSWVREHPTGWRCIACGAVAHHSQEVGFAALLENRAGEDLRTLEREGRILLDADSDQ